MDRIDIQTAEYLVEVAKALAHLRSSPVWDSLASAYITEVTFGVDGDNLGFKLAIGESGVFEILEDIPDLNMYMKAPK